MKQRHNNKKGFSLVESAIVLGVVGLIIGGIWVAAAAIMENRKVTETEKGILTTATNMQRVFSKRDSESLGAGGNISFAIRDIRIYPDDWPYDTSAPVDGGQASITPFGGYLYVTSFRPGVSWDGFQVYLEQIPNGMCAKLVTRMSSKITGITGIALKLIQVYNGVFATNITTSISINAAKTACDSSSVNEYIMFVFDYTRTN